MTFECDFPPEARTRRVVSTSSLPSGLGPAEIDATVSTMLAAGEDLYHLDEQALADLDADVLLTQDLCAVCAVDAESHFVRPGPRLVDGAEIVGRILHPDLVGPPAPDHARRVDH